MNRFRQAATLVLVAAALLVLPGTARAGRTAHTPALGKLAGRFVGSLAGPQGLFHAVPAAAAVAKGGSAQAPPAGAPPAPPGGQAPAPGTVTAQNDGRGTLIPDGQH